MFNSFGPVGGPPCPNALELSVFPRDLSRGSTSAPVPSLRDLVHAPRLVVGVRKEKIFPRGL